LPLPRKDAGSTTKKSASFYHDDDDYVAFSGSTNESREALVHNYECVDVYPSWDAASRARSKRAHFEALRHHGPHHERDEYLLDPENSVLLCSRMALQGVLKRLSDAAKRRALIVHDEVHRFGSASHVAQLDGLAGLVPWRLGLSATPDREYDQEGNAFIARNVGPVIIRYSLENAVADGILCEFDYVPLEWDPSDADRREVQALMRRRAASASRGNPMSEEEFRREVARVYKISVEKVPIFERFVAANPAALGRCIIFLAEKAYGELVREHIHAITPRFHTYFDVDNSTVLREFATGVIDCLITCHRVSEGIDIRSVKAVVLLSADRARLETIQRIGRCLRIDRNDPEKRAPVVDFIRRAMANDDPTADEERRVWLQKLSSTRRAERVESE
jgi:superfamily II DNA or RNA helicase